MFAFFTVRFHTSNTLQSTLNCISMDNFVTIIIISTILHRNILGLKLRVNYLQNKVSISTVKIKTPKFVIVNNDKLITLFKLSLFSLRRTGSVSPLRSHVFQNGLLNQLHILLQKNYVRLNFASSSHKIGIVLQVTPCNSFLVMVSISALQT
jgi:hypothetical protein